MSHSPRTLALLSVTFGHDLARLAHAYFVAKSSHAKHIGKAGNYEECESIIIESHQNHCLYDACRGGYLLLIEYMISRGATDWDLGLYGACRGGHLGIANLMIAHGAKLWNWCLDGACRGGHLELVTIMIAHGATDWDRGLDSACCGGHLELAAIMIAHGASDLNNGLSWACRKGRSDMVRVMIAHGAIACHWCEKPMSAHGKGLPPLSNPIEQKPLS